MEADDDDGDLCLRMIIEFPLMVPWSLLLATAFMALLPFGTLTVAHCIRNVVAVHQRFYDYLHCVSSPSSSRRQKLAAGPAAKLIPKEDCFLETWHYASTLSSYGTTA